MSGGRGLPAYKPDIPPAAALPPVRIDHSQPVNNVIDFDKRDGSTTSELPNGALFIAGPAVKERDRSKARDFDENLAEDPEVPLSTIASKLLEGIRADIASRKDWEETANKGRDLLGIKLEDASSDVSADGTISTVKDLGLLEAVIRSWANSRAELLPAAGPVKVSDDLPFIDRTPLMGHNGGPPLEDTPPAPALAPPPGGPLAPAAPQGGITAQAPPATGAPPPAAPTPPQNAETPLQGQPKRSELAEALEKDMNHFLTVRDREYVPDFSRMLLNRAINGIQFRKVYRDPVLRRPASRWVKGIDLIVSNDCSHLSGAGRVTERIKYRQAMVKRLQKIGHWRECTLNMPTPDITPTDRNIGENEGVKPAPERPEDQQHTIYECYCELDDGELAFDNEGKNVGWPLPYRVTLDKDSEQILEIRRNWKEGDIDYTPRVRYVKYGFVPGLGFYDWGLVHILGNSAKAVTGATRMTLDAGMFASFPGGLMAKGPGTRQRTNVVRPGPGEFAVIETGGMKI